MEQKSSYFDIILLADVLWNEENFKILLNSCDGLSDKHTAIYLAYADYQTANVNYFFELARDNGFKIQDLFVEKIHPKGDNSCLDVYDKKKTVFIKQLNKAH